MCKGNDSKRLIEEITKNINATNREMNKLNICIKNNTKQIKIKNLIITSLSIIIAILIAIIIILILKNKPNYTKYYRGSNNVVITDNNMDNKSTINVKNKHR